METKTTVKFFSVVDWEKEQDYLREMHRRAENARRRLQQMIRQRADLPFVDPPSREIQHRAKQQFPQIRRPSFGTYRHGNAGRKPRRRLRPIADHGDPGEFSGKAGRNHFRVLCFRPDQQKGIGALAGDSGGVLIGEVLRKQHHTVKHPPHFKPPCGITVKDPEQRGVLFSV